MRKIVFAIIILIGFVLVGCKPTEDPKITIEKEDLSLEVGEELQLKPIVTNLDNFVLKYSSSANSVVTVDEEGNLCCLAAGFAKVTITVDGYPDLKLIVDITVKEKDSNDDEEKPKEYENQLEVIGIKTIVVGEQHTLDFIDHEDTGDGVVWQHLTPELAKINQNGEITTLKPGVARFRIMSKENGESMEFEIEIESAEVKSVEIKANLQGNRLRTTADLRLKANVLPEFASQDVLWKSNDERVAIIDSNGFVEISSYGEVTFTAISIENEDVLDTYTVEFYWDVVDLVSYLMVSNPVVNQKVTTFGNSQKNESAIGSVSNYYFGDYPFKRQMGQVGRVNIPDTKLTSIEFITFHDTGNNNVGANAAMHASYMNGATNQVSWHYSVGDDGVYQQIEDDNVSYHAGDGSRLFGLNDTGVKATSTIKPNLAISNLGFYTLNGITTAVKAPDVAGRTAVTSDLNDYGIYMEIGENGNWYLNNSWYSSTYGLIGNQGGNRNSISIESCVNQGADLYLIWHYSAKLIAKLLIDHDLSLDRLMFHHHWSGKNCPQTMRMNGLVPNFLKMVEAEYLALKFLSDYKITLSSNNSDIINNQGRIIKLPSVNTEVSVLVNISNDSGFNVNKVYFSTIPSK